jgi:hypothetical protein
MRSSLSLALRIPTPAVASAVALAAAHTSAGLNTFDIIVIAAAGLHVLYLVGMAAYTYWRIAFGWDVRPVRKERLWSWRYDPESGQFVPLEPALSKSTSFYTVQSLENLHAGIYDVTWGAQHEHVCSSDLHKPGPAHKPAHVVVVVAAPAEEGRTSPSFSPLLPSSSPSVRPSRSAISLSRRLTTGAVSCAGHLS